MMLKDYQRYARWVLCAAILFVAGNTAHAIEHDVSTDLSKSHNECHHCSVELTAAVSDTPSSTLPPSAADCAELSVSRFVAPPTSTFKARAPPLS